MATAKPMVLEPLVNLELSVPADTMGNVCGDITSRRGQVLGTKALPRGDLRIKALAPLGELSDFAGRFKSLTGGHGSYTVVFSHYERTPDMLQAELASEWSGHAEE